MDGGKLAIDLTKLVADLATGAGPFALAEDLAAAIYDQIGAEKLRQLGALFVAHASAHIEAQEMDSPVQDAPWRGP